MYKLPELPISQAELEKYRIDAQRRPATGQVGGHVIRRLGDSLDFREFTYYQPGDDIRHVDWRASMRPSWRSAVHPSGAWLVRRFDAEERLKIVVSLDTRPTMHLPEALPKLHVAGWIAEALSFVALRSGDEVVFHRLFGTPALCSARLRGPGAVRRLRSALDQVLVVADEKSQPNVAILDRELPPAAVWIVVSDLYFDPLYANNLVNRMAAARRGRRWVVLVELDSWPYERGALGKGLWAIHGPSGPGPESKLVYLSPQKSDPIHEAEARLEAHREAVLAGMKGPLFDYSRWLWPDFHSADVNRFFGLLFENDKPLQRLFRSVPWR